MRKTWARAASMIVGATLPRVIEAALIAGPAKSRTIVMWITEIAWALRSPSFDEDTALRGPHGPDPHAQNHLVTLEDRLPNPGVELGHRYFALATDRTDNEGRAESAQRRNGVVGGGGRDDIADQRRPVP